MRGIKKREDVWCGDNEHYSCHPPFQLVCQSFTQHRMSQIYCPYKACAEDLTAVLLAQQLVCHHYEVITTVPLSDFLSFCQRL